MRREREAWRQLQVENLMTRCGWDRDQLPPSVEQDDITGQYGVAGFSTQQSYDAREPTWGEDEGPFPSEAEAMEAARDWLAAQGSEAQVEIHHFVTNNEAEVVAVVTKSSVERIGS